MVLEDASEDGANALSTDAYVKLLSTGEGLSDTKKAATKTAWEGKSMVDPLFMLPAGGRNYRRTITSEVSLESSGSALSVMVIATGVAEAMLGTEIDGTLSSGRVLSALGEAIGAAVFGIVPGDLSSYGDLATFGLRSPGTVGAFLRSVLNRARDGQTPIQPEHPALTKLGRKLCRRAAAEQGADTVQRGAASLPATATRTLADIHREGDEKEARKRTAGNLVQAAKGIASIQVLRDAEQDDQIKALR